MSTSTQLIGCLQRYGPSSRTDLSRQLNLSKPTMSVTIDTLLKRGVLEEIGPGRASGGRPPTLLRLNARYRLILGVELDVRTLQMALGDLSGEALGYLELEYDQEAPEVALRAAARTLLTEHASTSKVQGVVLGLPGVVEDGWLHYAPNMPHLERPGALKRLRSAFGAAVQIGNDVNLAAVGEARNDELLVFLWIGSGMGVGIAQGKQVFAGHKGRAGEIGYLPTTVGGGPTLERLLSADGLAGLLALTTEQLKVALHGHDPAILRSVRTAPFFDSLAFALQVLSLTLDPARIVLGGQIGIKLGSHLGALRSSLLAQLPFAPDLDVAARPQHAVTAGALKVAAATAFQDVLHELDGKRARAAPAPLNEYAANGD